MIGKFFKDDYFYYFVVNTVGYSDENYTVCTSDFKALNISTIDIYERDCLKKYKEISMNEVPRSFLAFCICRFPRSME